MHGNLTSHIERKARRSIEIDWSCPIMSVVDAEICEASKVYLFVGSLSYSRYDYVEPTLDMKQDTWLLRHVRMFDFYGGSAPRIVPDNLKTGVVKHPREGEGVLNDAYREVSSRTRCTAVKASPSGLMRSGPSSGSSKAAATGDGRIRRSATGFPPSS